MPDHVIYNDPLDMILGISGGPPVFSPSPPDQWVIWGYFNTPDDFMITYREDPPGSGRFVIVDITWTWFPPDPVPEYLHPQSPFPNAWTIVEFDVSADHPPHLPNIVIALELLGEDVFNPFFLGDRGIVITDFGDEGRANAVKDLILEQMSAYHFVTSSMTADGGVHLEVIHASAFFGSP